MRVSTLMLYGRIDIKGVMNCYGSSIRDNPGVLLTWPVLKWYPLQRYQLLCTNIHL